MVFRSRVLRGVYPLVKDTLRVGDPLLVRRPAGRSAAYCSRSAHGTYLTRIEGYKKYTEQAL